jgi:hypothetical protein
MQDYSSSMAASSELPTNSQVCCTGTHKGSEETREQQHGISTLAVKLCAW